MTATEPHPTTTAAAPPPVPTGIASVLRRPQFTLLVVGQTVSQLGDKLHHMALLSLIAAAAATSTSGIELAKIAIAVTAPVVLFGPIAGALVDGWNKRLTMIVCDAVRTVLVAGIPWLYRATNLIWPVYVVAFMVGLLGLFFNSSKMALIPDLVERPQLLSANAALTSIGRLATVAGIVGGGMLTTWSVLGLEGYEVGFYLDAMSYAVSVLTLIVIFALSAAHRRRNPSSHVSGSESAAVVKREFAHLLGDMRQAVREIRQHRDLRFSFGTVVLLGIIAGSIYVVMTASVQNVMGRGTRGVGFLGGLLAAGMVLGSLLVGSVGARWSKRQIVLLSSASLGLFMVVGSLRYEFSTFMPIAFLGGVLMAPVMVSQDTMLHESAPAGSRALIFSTRDLVLAFSFMGWSLLVGAGVPLLGALGAREPFRLALGVLGILVAVLALGGEAVLAGRAARKARA